MKQCSFKRNFFSTQILPSINAIKTLIHLSKNKYYTLSFLIIELSFKNLI
jgi:hypothetical protein